MKLLYLDLLPQRLIFKDYLLLCLFIFRKTTVAKILRRVLQKLKVTTSSKYTEISARELKAADAPHLFQKNKDG